MWFPFLAKSSEGVDGNQPTFWNNGVPSNFYDDIFEYVTSVDWRWGMAQYSEAIAEPSEMVVTLDNSSGIFTPENSTSPLYPILLNSIVRLTAERQVGLTTEFYNLYNGQVQRIEVDVGARGEQLARLYCGDPSMQLQQSEFDMPLLLNVTTDTVLRAVFDAPAVIYPYASMHFLVGVEGYAELGATTFLFAQNITSFDTGDTTFEYAGDIEHDDIVMTADRLIREYIYAELGGRFFWDHTRAQFAFHRRNRYNVNDFTPIDLPMLELDEPPRYIWGDDVVNHVTVNYYPRSIGAPASTVYTMRDLPLEMTSGMQRTFTVRYTDPDAPDSTVSVIDQITPEANVDFLFNSHANGAGDDRSLTLNVLVTWYANRAEIVLRNTGIDTSYLISFRLRATPLIAHDRESVVRYDGLSMALHGDRRRSLDFPALSSEALASTFANLLLQRYKSPLGRFAQISLWGNRTDDNLDALLSLGVGSVVNVTDSSVQNTIKLYVVTALRHRLDPTASHWLRVWLEPLDRSIFWILDDAENSILGVTTRLAAL